MVDTVAQAGDEVGRLLVAGDPLHGVLEAVRSGEVEQGATATDVLHASARAGFAVVQQRDRLGPGGHVGVEPDQRVDPVWLDGLVPAPPPAKASRRTSATTPTWSSDPRRIR